jgi:hypothetical protein
LLVRIFRNCLYAGPLLVGKSMKYCDEKALKEAYDRGYRDGTHDGAREQWYRDKERFAAEVSMLVAQNTKILEHVANLEILKPYTFVLEKK